MRGKRGTDRERELYIESQQEFMPYRGLCVRADAIADQAVEDYQKGNVWRAITLYFQAVNLACQKHGRKP